MSLADTEAGAAWVYNFRPEDRAIATDLLGAFILDSWSRARADLLDLARQEIALYETAGPIWIVPALDAGDIRRLAGLPKTLPLVAFENFEPGMNIPSTPGSEGLIGHLLRDTIGKNVLSPSTPLNILRKKKIRTVLIVTDTVETGGQARQYVQALLRNPTIRSWLSFRWIKIVVLSYAASPGGAQVLEHESKIHAFKFVRHAPTIRSLPWSAAGVQAALSLCKDYGRGTNRLGYGEHGGLFGFLDRLPNTVPTIFRQQGPDWTPLFSGRDGRQVSTTLAQEFHSSPVAPPAHDEIVAAVRQERLSVSIGKQQRESNRDILTALAVLSVSPGQAGVLGGALQMTQGNTDALLRYLDAQGWVDDQLKVTAQGRAELAAGKRKTRRVERRNVVPTDESYYPHSLR
ncbi:phosphoribosyltransferase-like protein [Curtobacterium sp. USHLN213]|uniref:phosphoribosyltransferase-like protein n=1 Tax=Curtobacterium sp. USHLN213 TaxID=3081255 RepID=UPI003FA552E5